MSALTLYQNGARVGVAPRKNDHERALRGVVGGWSMGAARRNSEFLKSVDTARLDGVGFAVTLTLKDCPPDAVAFHRLRTSWLKRLERAGVLRVHWVVEWQRRGVPHLHAAVYFPSDWVHYWDNELHQRMRMNVNTWLVAMWLECEAGRYRSGWPGQFVEPVTGPVGWLKYLAKHASRGVGMYQRSAENVPEAWRGRTGRVWGHGGEWPMGPVVKLDVQASDGDGGYYPLRRMMRSWRVADARAERDPALRIRRIVSARHCLRCRDRGLSRVRGLSEWIEFDVMIRMVDNLATRGYAIGAYVKASERAALAQRAEGVERPSPSHL